jgi:hypothetical protein
MKKPQRITGPMQQVAVDILHELECILIEGKPVTNTQVTKVLTDNFKKYNLNNDPFTGLVCSDKEWSESSQEYNRQKMEEMYDHHDGI